MKAIKITTLFILLAIAATGLNAQAIVKKTVNNTLKIVVNPKLLKNGSHVVHSTRGLNYNVTVEKGKIIKVFRTGQATALAAPERSFTSGKSKKSQSVDYDFTEDRMTVFAKDCACWHDEGQKMSICEGSECY